MARIDTTGAQTKAQRQAKQRAKASKQATAQARVNRLRKEANARDKPGRAAPAAPKAKAPPRRIARETRVDRIVEAQTEGFRTPKQFRAAQRKKR